ncbi:putative asparagine synthase [Flammula alnicola]|nr:putative asparagine synthase [Flammula alnicola]
MCGITASYVTSPEAIPDPTTLTSELHASILVLGHRGPDSTGIYVSEDSCLGLGHARLSVIDVEGGIQPLHDSDGNIHAVVNGELYDYADLRQELEKKGSTFQTFSDSELVIQLYKIHGFNFIHYLRGEFAFVLYDSQRKVLFAARDRFGVKPLFYTLFNGRLMISSEMKALSAFGWKSEWDVQSILEMGEFNDNRTVFKGVFKLPPAHQLTFTRMGQLKIQPYWDQSYLNPRIADTRSLEDIIQGARDLIVDAVRARLRSDVPLGIYLSGGIDSATIAGIASTLLKEKNPSAKVVTFTLSFPEHEDLDEGPVAKRMAEMIGADINMVTPTEADLISRFDQAVYHIEQPVYTLHACGKLILSEHVRDQGYKVVLTGEGADEVLGGYSFHILDYIRAPDAASSSFGLPLPSPPELAFILKLIESMPPPQDHTSISDMSLTDSQLARSMFGGISSTRVWATMSAPVKLFHPRALEIFGVPDHTMAIVEGLRPEARAKTINGSWHPLHAALVRYTSTNTTLPLLLNQVGDRPEMANSVEGRQPFLDHKFVEYINNLPPYAFPLFHLTFSPLTAHLRSLKIMPQKAPTGQWFFTEKWILRQAVKPYITEEICLRKKSQYNVPISRPTQNGDIAGNELSPLQVFLKERVTKEKVDALGFMNWENIKALLNDYVQSPECPMDGGLDKRARVLLCVVSFTVLQARFNVPAAIF